MRRNAGSDEPSPGEPSHPAGPRPIAGLRPWRRETLSLTAEEGLMAKVKSKSNTASSKRAAGKGGAASGQEQRTEKRRSKRRVDEAAIVGGASAAEPDQSLPRPETKQALIMSLLAREAGASLDELVSATRWLPHTTRAALTRLRQSGYVIVRSKDEAGRTRYRIEAARPASRSRKTA
jgi:hypothetical protein